MRRPPAAAALLPHPHLRVVSPCLTEFGLWRPFSINFGETGQGGQLLLGGGCPVSLNLARQHDADLRRVRFAETASGWLSHGIWPAMAILSALSHPNWPNPPTGDRDLPRESRSLAM
jgi:hypothetical protein